MRRSFAIPKFPSPLCPSCNEWVSLVALLPEPSAVGYGTAGTNSAKPKNAANTETNAIATLLTPGPKAGRACGCVACRRRTPDDGTWTRPCDAFCVRRGTSRQAPEQAEASTNPSSVTDKADGYHHGDLRAALQKSAEEIIRESGVEGLMLRACAQRAGVSHGAPAHHFGNIAGLLTEFAVEGLVHTICHALAGTFPSHVAQRVAG